MEQNDQAVGISNLGNAVIKPNDMNEPFEEFKPAIKPKKATKKSLKVEEQQKREDEYEKLRQTNISDLIMPMSMEDMFKAETQEEYQQ